MPWKNFYELFLSILGNLSNQVKNLLILFQLLHTILQAQKEHEAVHVIYLDKSFTGDIVKYDKEANKLILKNFQKNMSAIISISDIKRLTLVPKTVRDSQRLEK